MASGVWAAGPRALVSLARRRHSYALAAALRTVAAAAACHPRPAVVTSSAALHASNPPASFTPAADAAAGPAAGHRVAVGSGGGEWRGGGAHVGVGARARDFLCATQPSPRHRLRDMRAVLGAARVRLGCSVGYKPYNVLRLAFSRGQTPHSVGLNASRPCRRKFAVDAAHTDDVRKNASLGDNKELTAHDTWPLATARREHRCGDTRPACSRCAFEHNITHTYAIKSG